MSMEVTTAHIISGLIGGLIRGLVGIIKNQAVTPEKFTFQWKYFTATMFVSAVVGIMSGIIANNDWRISLLAGYAGTDFLEGLYRLKFAQFFKVG